MLTQAVACQPQRIATISGERRRTWAEIGARVPRLAAALRGFGIRDGAFVAALAMNSDRYVELFFAVPWAGGAFAPLNIRWSVAENAYALTDSKASVLFVDDAFVDQARALQQQLAWVKALVYMGERATPAGMLGTRRWWTRTKRWRTRTATAKTSGSFSTPAERRRTRRV